MLIQNVWCHKNVLIYQSWKVHLPEVRLIVFLSSFIHVYFTVVSFLQRAQQSAITPLRYRHM